MPASNRLTPDDVKNAHLSGKPKLWDGEGMYLIPRPDGRHWWRLKFYFQGREQLMSLGTYPDTSLSSARKKRTAARAQLAKGINPNAQRQAERSAYRDTFKAIAEEWLGLQKNLSADTVDQLRRRLETHLYPKIGNDPIGEIDVAELLRVLRGIEDQGRHETAHRCRALAGRIFRYAMVTKRAEHDPTQGLKGALASIKKRHHPAITDPQKVGALLRDLDAYAGRAITRCALRLAPLVFVRPGELRTAEWSEFDLAAAEWRIPAAKMKMKETHIVPLSRQAVAILREAETLTGGGRYVFPSMSDDERPMSENTVNAALRKLDYASDEMTGHGFRTIASTFLNEQGFHPDLIELQLAHAERDESRGAYNRALRLPERRKMMQAWADYLDRLRKTKPKRQG
jgi:integrase